MPLLSCSQTFRLPPLHETFSVFPDNGLNPNYNACRAQSRAWISKYNVQVCGPKMRAFMDNCNFELSNAYVYPYAQPAGLRATMDLANILWLYDEYTDMQTGEDAAKAAVTVSKTLLNPEYDDDTWICHMMRDFYVNHIQKCRPNVAHRFIENFCRYTEVVGTEAKLREKNEVLDIPGYVALRREISAVRTCFDLVEYCLDLDFPDYVHKDPIFVIGYNAAMDLVFWANDLFSYNSEQAKGHAAANVVTVIMTSKKMNLQSTVDFIAGFCEALTFQLLDAKRALSLHEDPTFSRDAVRCLEAFGDWVRGNDAWSFATTRYFGPENKIVKETRIVKLKAPVEESVALKE
ncbi:hypothetical protein M422DRAFT_47084 [Sphaerobolus stellatus SS14]|uniref:Sesquiterpene synthase M422DRAFT_47084 n=1 Tax=Sphaerobolus stellatus (strain SS14) TaxID=990650 RepID=TERS_SPHS4|nr:RecName: Full=Sesquiterpene synthase M422DRAFT_47084; AltName: Full=Terpene cyclase M422DRAFT_47084 [Sphaerobolus stellatus SS14]KIJ44869.1 hypothetical protein M422DRAFT_47084 [Sphaerobolus stellatus SS14]